MKRNAILLIILLQSLIISCDRDANLRIPEHEPRLVVNAIWHPSEPMWVHVSRSHGITEEIDPNDLIIDDAVVELWENGVKLDNFEYRDTIRPEVGRYYYEDTSLVKYGQYFHPQHATPKPGKFYQLKVSHPDFEDVFAECRIPVSASIADITVEFDAVTETDVSGANTTYHVINATVIDPRGEENYYALSLIRVYKNTSFPNSDTIYEGDIPLLDSYGLNTLVPKGSIIFSDENRDGKAFWELFFIRKIAYLSGGNGAPEPDRYIFTLFSMNKPLGKYIEGRYKQYLELGNENPFFAPGSAIIESNIEGGYGVFGASQAVQFEVIF